MSGGFFGYEHYRIATIAEIIQTVIDKNFKPIEPKDKWGDWDDREFYYNYPEEVIESFKEAVKILRVAQVYSNRIDLLLSSDDSVETFLTLLGNELKTIEKNTDI